MNGLAPRGLCSCNARATSSLPVPDSPVISTDTLERDWRRAITDIAVPMLQGAAVYTAMMAEQLSEE